MRVLDVGSGAGEMMSGKLYVGWERVRLDIDPLVEPDLCMDARDLVAQEPDQFDAIYCSHNLEHYFQHDAFKVLQGFARVLKRDGFVEIFVPDVGSVIKEIVDHKGELSDALYTSPAGPITGIDIIYGWQQEIVVKKSEFYAHRNGFTAKSLRAMLRVAGFPVTVVMKQVPYNLRALAFLKAPSPARQKQLGIAV
jgi:SAM-dependent methyltransferase